MHLKIDHIKQFALFYLICFSGCYLWFVANGLLFSEINPVFFLNRLDFTGNIFMLSNIQYALIEYKWLRVLWDAVYLILPFVLVYTVYFSKKGQVVWAIATAVFALLYNYFFSMMSFVSIEGFVAWMFIPLVFAAKGTKGFYFSTHCIRILFLLFFFTTALWKIRSGGVFNPDQLSAILFKQHLPILVAGDDYWFSRFISFLINHQRFTYLIYLLVVIIEFVFVVGFFTRKYDRLLILFFCFFVLFDYFLMEINYFAWFPFLGCLYFSGLTLEEA